MELWIRDKSKKVLQKVERVEYLYRNNIHSIVVGCDSIGIYATEERCLEIIDEIQKLLLSVNPKEAFMLLKGFDSEDYAILRAKIKQARKDNFLPFCSGSDNNSSIEILQPNVLVYEMPEK